MGHVPEGGEVVGAGAGGGFEGALGGAAAEGEGDGLEALGLDDGADVVEAGAEEAVGRLVRHHHGDEAAARGAEDRHAVEP